MYFKQLGVFWLFSLMAIGSTAQTFTSYWTGDTTDVVTQPTSVTLLAGGGSDNNVAMQWWLQHAVGGDVVVLRASGSDGYNDYLFTELGVAINSVQTIRFDAPAAAADPYVIEQIRAAEALFIAGGNQTRYYDYWYGTPVQEALDYLINEKRIPVGGTSAGMAILSGHYYTPLTSGVISEEALADPYHPFIDSVRTQPFLAVPYLTEVITDTHYDQRDRHGRHLVFLARTALATGAPTFGIACNEYVAVGIDSTGQARVFGEYPAYDDFAYFLRVDCSDPYLPEGMTPEQPLHWVRDSQAVRAYRIPGTPAASNTFDLIEWTGSGGEWFDWWVETGTLYEVPGVEPICLPVAAHAAAFAETLSLYPNPVEEQLTLPDVPFGEWHCWTLQGRLQWQATARVESLSVQGWAIGTYLLRWRNEQETRWAKFVVK